MKQTFPIAPGSNGPFWMMGGVSLLLIALIVFLMYIAYSSRNTKFEISSEGLRIKGDIYGCYIPASSLLIDQAKAVNMIHQPDFRLGWSRNGSRMPGYKAGWFRIGNREKVLAFITDKEQVVYIPTAEGYAVMFSVESPEVFIDTIRQTIQ